MAHTIKNLGKVFAKAQTHEVIRVSGVRYDVISSVSGEKYFVNLADNGYVTCTCPRQLYIGLQRNGGQNMCSHVQAAIIFELAETGVSLTPRTSNEDLSKLHRQIVDMGGDNVVFSARKDVPAYRRLRKEVVDDRGSDDRNSMSADEINELLFGVVEYA